MYMCTYDEQKTYGGCNINSYEACEVHENIVRDSVVLSRAVGSSKQRSSLYQIARRMRDGMLQCHSNPTFSSNITLMYSSREQL